MTRVLVPDGLDKGALWHRGSPNNEAKLLDAGFGWADLSHRAIVSISGNDRLSWLNNLTTQELKNFKPDYWVSALILDAHGHINHQLFLFDDGQETWIHTEGSLAEDLIAFLEKMKFMLQVEVNDRRNTHILLRAPKNPTYAEKLMPDKKLYENTSESHWELIGGPFQIILKQQFEDTTAAWGVENEVGMWALDADRIAKGRVRILLETDHKTIPNELNLLNNAVALNKGCYPGQETVAKVNNLGKPPRKLVFIHLDGSDNELPNHGDAIEFEDKTYGFVTSAARHYELGPIALGLVKRSFSENFPAPTFNIGNTAGRIEPWKQ